MGEKKLGRVPVGPVAIAGLVCLAVSLSLRTSWFLLGGLSLHGHSTQDTHDAAFAVKRFCIPGPATAQRQQPPATRRSARAVEATGDEHSEPASLSDIDALITQPARVHGRQVKAGMPANWRDAMAHMVNMQRWLPAGLPPNKSAQVERWVDLASRKYVGAQMDDDAPVRSPVPSCHYLVDHAQRIIFVRTTKIGGTTLANVLGITNHPVACTLAPSRCREGCQGRPMCLTYMTDPEEAQRVWSNYTVFSFVRNPWTRAISSYHFNQKRAIRKQCQRPFNAFAASPTSQALVCYNRLETCCRERYGFVLEHLEAQTPGCLFTEQGLPAVDFIGRSERFDEDFQKLVELLNSRDFPGAARINTTKVARLNTGLGRSELEKRRFYARHYANNSALCDVRKYYAEDFELLKFPSLGT